MEPIVIEDMDAVDIDGPEPTALTRAWRAHCRIEKLKADLKREKAAYADAVADAREAGERSVDLGYGTVTLGETTFTRFVDVERFRALYPHVFDQVAEHSINLKDAERVLGDRIGDVIKYREKAAALHLIPREVVT